MDLFLLHEGLYKEGGPLTEDADVRGQSLPNPVQSTMNVYGIKRIVAAGNDNLDGPKKADFKINFRGDGRGKYITRSGAYYVDVRFPQLIVDDKIKVQQNPDGIKGSGPHALVLAYGKKLEANIVVLATGDEQYSHIDT